MARMRYMVVVERGETSWGAHAPDLPGCVAVGETREEVLRLIREAIEFSAEAWITGLYVRTAWSGQGVGRKARRALGAGSLRGASLLEGSPYALR